MRYARLLVALLGALLLSGCAGFGIVATSDPLTKLNDAADLFERQDRPLPAERLIREAIAIYQEDNDLHGLGNAYREYGDLLRSPAVAKWETVYRRDGFLDKSVTFDNRLAKASENFTKALEYYQRSEQQLRDSAKFDALTNVYYNMAWCHYLLNEHDKACGYFDKTVDAYNENIRRNPGAHQYVAPSSVGSVLEVVESDKRRVGCH